MSDLITLEECPVSDSSSHSECKTRPYVSLNSPPWSFCSKFLLILFLTLHFHTHSRWISTSGSLPWSGWLLSLPGQFFLQVSTVVSFSQPPSSLLKGYHSSDNLANILILFPTVSFSFPLYIPLLVTQHYTDGLIYLFVLSTVSLPC
jgi:hypothetical protein